MEKKIAIVAVVVAALFLAGTFIATKMKSTDAALAACGAGAIAGGAVGGPFELVNSSGKTVTNEDVITEPSLIYFGYTFCPDICPTDAMRNAVATDLLDEQGTEVTPIFISIDPERDTPEAVGYFANNFHERMIGLTGSVEQTTAASKAYKTYFAKEANGDPDYYLVDHSTYTYLNIPGMGVVDYFNHTDDPETVAERTACIVDAVGAN